MMCSVWTFQDEWIFYNLRNWKNRKLRFLTWQHTHSTSYIYAGGKLNIERTMEEERRWAVCFGVFSILSPSAFHSFNSMKNMFGECVIFLFGNCYLGLGLTVRVISLYSLSHSMVHAQQRKIAALANLSSFVSGAIEYLATESSQVFFVGKLNCRRIIRCDGIANMCLWSQI